MLVFLRSKNVKSFYKNEFNYLEAITNYQANLFCFIALFNGSVEYNVSYVYHAMYAYFDRDNIALKGLAK